MEVKIGVTHASRELTLDINASTPTTSRRRSATRWRPDNASLTLTDDKGRTVFVPVDKLAYVEITGDTGRRVGFGAA